MAELRSVVVDGGDTSTRHEKLMGIPKHTSESQHVIEKVYVLDVPKLPEENSKKFELSVISDASKAEYLNIIDDRDVILADIVRKVGQPPVTRAFIRGGPRQKAHFNPPDVKAAVVTCGGLCPGINNVIREITNTLFFLYNVREVWGVLGGYGGFARDPVALTPQYVDRIHHTGGSVLGCSRGGFDLKMILKFIKERSIDQLYIIGGDGTHRGAFEIGKECERLNMNVVVVGIPKTIDNDLDLLDRSFGFETAVDQAQAAITAAKVEAMCNFPNGIGIVKLMGRSTGYIAAFATLASGDVDLCLIPEVPIQLEGERGCLPHLKRRLAEKGHAVVVVAEGAGEDLLQSRSTETDASGNKKLPPIGLFLKDKIEEFFSQEKIPVSVKYIDPSYMIRSVPPNSADSRYCAQVGQNAVHGAMHGFTRFTVGLCNNRICYLPIPAMVEGSPRGMRQQGRTWERVLSLTLQPNPKL